MRRQESVREARRPGEGEVGSAWRTALPGCAKGSVAWQSGNTSAFYDLENNFTEKLTTLSD